MSRGLGRIQQVIRAAFEVNPNRRFTTDDLVVLAFPGADRPTKGQRVAVLRAADSVASDLGWEKSRTSRGAKQIGRIVIYRSSAKILEDFVLGQKELAALND